MASAASREIVIQPKTQLLSAQPQPQPLSSSIAITTTFTGYHKNEFPGLFSSVSSHRIFPVPAKSSPGKDGVVSSTDNNEGLSLGTMKLSPETNIPRFETLLFQWANSLNQGAQLPLPVPMKVDKIAGGVRLGFVSMDDGKANVEVYIDCTVISSSNGVMFKATRKGALKDRVPPGEPRIMKSLLAALKMSAQLARA